MKMVFMWSVTAEMVHFLWSTNSRVYYKDMESTGALIYTWAGSRIEWQQRMRALMCWRALSRERENVTKQQNMFFFCKLSKLTTGWWCHHPELWRWGNSSLLMCFNDVTRAHSKKRMQEEKKKKKKKKAGEEDVSPPGLRPPPSEG